MVAIVQPLEFLMEHIPLLKVTAKPALASLLMDISVKAISSACMAPLNVTLVLLDLFGSSMWRSPIPMVVRVWLSAVVIFRWMDL